MTGDQAGSESPYSIGIVLSGGGSFGAWEIGALQALWDVWSAKHSGQPAPIRVVAGASTGAVIAPFALLDRKYLNQVDSWYQKVTTGDVSGLRPELLLPGVLFFLVARSALDFGYPKRFLSDRYYQNYKKALTEKGLQTLETCARAWDYKRLAIATVDFGAGKLETVRNWPQDIPLPGPSGLPPDPYQSRLYDGIVASAMAPLIGPPITLRQSDPPRSDTAHFDGGVCSEVPFAALFETAAIDPPIPLTHVVAISSYPYFPGADVATRPFPTDPKMMDTGLRFDSLLSEASAMKDIQIARAALELLRRGMSPAEVAGLTGLSIAGPPPILIEAVPRERMGWNNGTFVPAEMTAMRDLGRSEATPIFQKALP
jgi:predicted acylesterase/phospholipase RssA